MTSVWIVSSVRTKDGGVYPPFAFVNKQGAIDYINNCGDSMLEWRVDNINVLDELPGKTKPSPGVYADDQIERYKE